MRGRADCRPDARVRFGGKSFDYRHYLRSLSTKPQAVRQMLPDLLEDLGDPFPAVWRQLETLHGPRDAARLMDGEGLRGATPKAHLAAEWQR